MGGPFPEGGPGKGRWRRWESEEPRCSVPSERIICFSEAVGFDDDEGERERGREGEREAATKPVSFLEFFACLSDACCGRG